jgi:hypothetical protein
MHPEIHAEIARQRQAALLAEARISRAGRATRGEQTAGWFVRLKAFTRRRPSAEHRPASPQKPSLTATID